LCTYTVVLEQQQQLLELPDARSWAAPDPGQALWSVRAGDMDTGQSITYKTFWWVTLLQPARWAAVLGQPSSLLPHSLWMNTISRLHSVHYMIIHEGTCLHGNRNWWKHQATIEVARIW
jgi:hypothetical protein